MREGWVCAVAWANAVLYVTVIRKFAACSRCRQATPTRTPHPHQEALTEYWYVKGNFTVSNVGLKHVVVALVVTWEGVFFVKLPENA